MERVAATVVVVALGDRKYVKLQRSAILMTPNDMPPSRRQRPTGNGESVVSVPTKRKQGPARARFANHQDSAPGPVDR